MNWEDANALKQLQESDFFFFMLLEERKSRFLGEIASLTQEHEIVKAVAEYKIATQVINQLAIMPITTGDQDYDY